MSTNNLNSVTTFMEQLNLREEVMPLVIEACSNYPALLESHKDHGQSFQRGAFECLGEVLRILKTKKIRDMNSYGCRQLVKACNEAECFKVNLGWLKPYIDSALAKKDIAENFHEIERMEQRIRTLEEELEGKDLKKRIPGITQEELQKLKQEELQKLKKDVALKKQGLVDLDIERNLEFPEYSHL
ncbi:uncharacterized protein LOC106771675 [Vigna radiata var. radiata]|uniref:Uncharacterized protein LOC106771675 n=1 Tax=Vigna radiata var. radiata TaxID=3916 RepID=A0A1S3V482_VIGRR|nr:uncharacterized protein LOC106771675 [Vigna radiata var. radiata]